MLDLDDLLENVNSKETFLAFIHALMNDKIAEDKEEKIKPSAPDSDGHNGWVNQTIPDFLESVHAFGTDSDQIKLDWKSFALLLYAGKFYE
jgi:hypothetical protein